MSATLPSPFWVYAAAPLANVFSFEENENFDTGKLNKQCT